MKAYGGTWNCVLQGGRRLRRGEDRLLFPEPVGGGNSFRSSGRLSLDIGRGIGEAPAKENFEQEGGNV